MIFILLFARKPIISMINIKDHVQLYNKHAPELTAPELTNYFAMALFDLFNHNFLNIVFFLVMLHFLWLLYKPQFSTQFIGRVIDYLIIFMIDIF